MKMEIFVYSFDYFDLFLNQRVYRGTGFKPIHDSISWWNIELLIF